MRCPLAAHGFFFMDLAPLLGLFFGRRNRYSGDLKASNLSRVEIGPIVCFLWVAAISTCLAVPGRISLYFRSGLLFTLPLQYRLSTTPRRP